MESKLTDKARRILHMLCLEISNRQVGSRGNREATEFLVEEFASLGFATESPTFDCIDWRQEGADLTAGGASFKALVSPYSLGGQIHAPLLVASTLEELKAVQAAGKTLLLRGELAKEQLMPKNFPFYNPEEHQRIIKILEGKAPAAIIAATTKNPETAGAVYPFPLIEDGDFDIPSVYMTEEEGARLARQAGVQIQLEIRARRVPAQGCNVVARRGSRPERRVVVFAHIDAKQGTPGALDNATGVTVLLLLAELLADYTGDMGIELVALNGEDYYSAPGEKLWLELNQGRFNEILLGVNLDGAGYHHGDSAYSLYECSSELTGIIESAFLGYEDITPGDPWYQGDHGLYLRHGVPALAITSQEFMEILAEFAHTPGDRPELVDVGKLVHIAQALRDIILELDNRSIE